MKNNRVLSKIILCLCFVVIFVIKFLLIESYGFLELFLMVVCLILLIINALELHTRKFLKVIIVFIIIWFSVFAVDYKRHRNMYQPLFVIQNKEYEYVGLGYKIVHQYQQEGDHVYQSKDQFYLFVFLIDEVKAVANTSYKNNIDNISFNISNERESRKVIMLRAGGGSSGGGSSGASSGSHSGRGTRSTRPTSLLSKILNYIIFIFLSFFTAIIFYFKILRASINSRCLLKLLDDKDSNWNYKNIEKQVIKTFYSIQESWTNMDMTSSKEYMDDDLYEQFYTKLEWMKMGNKQNILKRIRLVNLKPISIHDDYDDEGDLIWFYIKGKMVDYMIDTNTNEKISGSDYSKSFVEFWKFVRKDDRWVLAKIFQKDEMDAIKFQDKFLS